ncbi:MAG TPA: C-type lectin domain-containing protein [Humisphaera sp.]
MAGVLGGGAALAGVSTTATAGTDNSVSATAADGTKYTVVFGDGLSWSQAKSAAAAHDAGCHLVTINSAAEQAFVQNLMTSANARGGTYWIGLQRSASTGGTGTNGGTTTGGTGSVGSGSGSGGTTTGGTNTGVTTTGGTTTGGTNTGGSTSGGNTSGGTTGGTPTIGGVANGSNGGIPVPVITGGTGSGGTGSTGTGSGSTGSGSTSGGSASGGTTTGGGVSTVGGVSSGSTGGTATGSGSAGTGSTGGASAGRPFQGVPVGGSDVPTEGGSIPVVGGTGTVLYPNGYVVPGATTDNPVVPTNIVGGEQPRVLRAAAAAAAGDLKWVTGESVTYTNFLAGQPGSAVAGEGGVGLLWAQDPTAAAGRQGMWVQTGDGSFADGAALFAAGGYILECPAGAEGGPTAVPLPPAAFLAPVALLLAWRGRRWALGRA